MTLQIKMEMNQRCPPFIAVQAPKAAVCIQRSTEEEINENVTSNNVQICQEVAQFSSYYLQIWLREENLHSENSFISNSHIQTKRTSVTYEGITKSIGL